MALHFKQYELTGESIDAISHVVQEYLTNIGTERQTIHRLRLTVEELLLHIRDMTGENTKVYIAVGKRFGQHVFRMFYRGGSYNPTSSSEDGWNDSIMASLGLKPAWNYFGGFNTFSLPMAPKAAQGTAANIFIAIFAAVVLSIAGMGLIPYQTRLEINQVFLSPLVDSYFGLMLSPGLVAFSTASSMAAMTLGMNTCEKKLGVDRSLVNFAYPLGTVIYMPGTIICFAVIVCTMAELYQVKIGISWLIMSVITITLITVALPPIPSSGVMAYSILFTRLGIPTDALLMATALELILDFIATGTSVLLLCLKIAEEGKLQGLLDRDQMLSPILGDE